MLHKYIHLIYIYIYLSCTHAPASILEAAGLLHSLRNCLAASAADSDKSTATTPSSSQHGEEELSSVVIGLYFPDCQIPLTCCHIL